MSAFDSDIIKRFEPGKSAKHHAKLCKHSLEVLKFT